MARKKKRSAKQLANDRRLGRMAKARAKAKRGGRRKKTVRKKNVHKTWRRSKPKKVAKRRVNKKRTALKKSHLWRIFRCRGKSVFWILMDSNGKWNWTKDAGKAILFATKQGAGNVARGIAKKRGYAAYQLGAAPREMSAAQIAAHCGGKV